MNSRLAQHPVWSLAGLALVIGASASLQAQPRRSTPLSKLYVASVDGASQINRGEKIEDMTTRSAYSAEGSIIETKAKATNALVYSNGTGIYFDPETRLEVKKFLQEPFTPNRNDLEVEPSVSQTDALLQRGTVGLCTSKLVAGSSMLYRTALGSVSMQSGKIVLETTADETRISVIEGDALVRGGDRDLGGIMVHPGTQAVLRRRTADSSAVEVTVQPISPNERSPLDEKIFAACTARKTVFFETKDNAGVAEIVPVPVVPASLPVPVTVSPATLPK